MKALKNITIDGIDYPLSYCHTLVLGSGAASLCTAVRLKRSGIDDLVIATDNISAGTSRNTGSDKQTYYKLSDSTITPDSPFQMAKALAGGGAMHGDIALAEALGSESGFYHLTGMGVPFPFNKWGGYTGYKTDHDPLNRGTSLGPYTSKVMVEYLEKECHTLDIPILDKHDTIKLIRKDDRIIGAVMLDKNRIDEEYRGLKVVLCSNMVFGLGGPGGLYKTSVYPVQHTGGIGLALEAGAKAVNLTESQYGIASIKFRWNLSGSYQQVIPRYYSVDPETGEEFDFLNSGFSSMKSLSHAIFLKGYQWPFDPKKVECQGSSLIDILVYQEIEEKGRRVFMNFLENPRGNDSIGYFSPDDLHEEVKEYWKNSGLTEDLPINRLEKLNHKAISLYQDHNIDLHKESLEIAVCAQHNNGGLEGDIWWESTNLPHFFPVGEVNGTHGIYRPGGTALNSGQVGAFRAAQKIAHSYSEDSLDLTKLGDEESKALGEMIERINTLLSSENKENTPKAYREEFQARMSREGAFVRDSRGIEKACIDAAEQEKEFKNQSCKLSQLSMALKNRHMVKAQRCYLEFIKFYLEQDGGSRGSCIVRSPEGKLIDENLGENWRSKDENESLCNKMIVLEEGQFGLEDCRPIPQEESWFETVWSAYLSKSVFTS